jgi:LuxR family transcriptional regulator, maltose regulon positive regulatory protein
MARRAIPWVIDDRLVPPASARQSLPTIEVGSEAWYAWLTEPATRSFTFHSPQGTLTARREHRHNTWYWYAYRSQNGHLHKAYLGKSEELTLVRLHTAATVLSAEKATRPQPPSSGTGMPSLHLLTTKLSVPPARSNIVARPRLTHLLQAAIRGPLTVIAAPAGWGKTTLLHAWHAEASRGGWSLAWVSVDGGDNDPLRFWTYVLTALNTLHPGVGQTPLALLCASSPPPIEDVLTPLLNALNQLPTETVLVLDDFHHIEAQPIHYAFSYLVEHLPPKLHLILASRSDPLLPLARLRVQGALIELRALDLRFTFEESTAFLIEVMGLPLSAEQVAALQERTEGWIAGLQLAALSLQGREEVAGFIETFTGSHRYVVDYLVEEVLVRQPADVQDFLVQTSILERLSGPLCDAVRGQGDSQALLEHIERSNLFLVALDDQREWYRYHHLFAEALRSRLQQTQPALVAELHRRASHWYEQHQLFGEAVAHALAAPDLDYAARLIEQYAQLTNFPSQFQILLGWLNHLPDALIRTQPTLCLMHANALVLTQQLEKASARVQDAERCLHKEILAQQRQALLGWIAAFRCFQARFLGDYDRCIPLARQALKLMQEMEVTPHIFTSTFRAVALVTAASAYLLDGDMTPATERQVAAAVAYIRAKGNLPLSVKSISNLARLQLLQGRLHQAATAVEQATQLVPQPAGLHTLIHGADYYFLLGELLREWNQLERAEQHLAQGLDLVKETMGAEAEMIMRGYLALARLQQACGQGSRALETLEAFAQLARQRGFASALLARGAAVGAQIELAQGNLAAAMRWAETSGVSITDALSYLREQEYLTLARVRIAQGREQPAGPFLPEALALLERLLEDAEPKARMSSVIEILLLRALALEAQGKQEEALRALGRALALAEPEGYIRLFLDEGAPMLLLLRQASAHQITPGYVVTLLEAAGEQVRPVPHRSASRSSQIMGSLTAREREVLRLMVDGASNREIAQQLVLSVNTVKKHVFNICSKLNVQGRAYAIAKARMLQLV